MNTAPPLLDPDKIDAARVVCFIAILCICAVPCVVIAMVAT